MKKNVLKIISVMLTFIIMSLTVFSNFSAAEVETETAFDVDKVLESRFLNMLNHNYVYGDDFNDIEDIVNNSAVAHLNCIDDDGYIDENILNNYLFDMYGFKLDDFSEINKEFGYKEGYVYILPRGFSLYEHKAVSLDKNEDGSLTFITDVIIKSHDDGPVKQSAKTVFVKNPLSIFGFNIVYSNLQNN